MLLGDGSPTRHLQLLTNQEPKIKLISMRVDPLFIEEGPKELNQLNGPLKQNLSSNHFAFTSEILSTSLNNSDLS